jgi:hypothetical protein
MSVVRGHASLRCYPARAVGRGTETGCGEAGTGCSRAARAGIGCQSSASQQPVTSQSPASHQPVTSQSPASHQPVTSQSPASHQPGYNQSATNHRPTISQSPQLSSVCQRIMIIWGSQCCVSAESVMRCFDYHCCTPIAKLALSLAAPGTFGIQQHAQAVNPHPIVDLL